MSLLQQWNDLASSNETKAFWTDYFAKEQSNYEDILSHHTEVIQGPFMELAERFHMEPVYFIGFLDGINTSLKEEKDLESVTEESEITLDVDFEKLYFNMLDCKADWLYNLEQWDDVLSKERRAEITKEYKASKIAVSHKVAGRNDPCPCGSGKKYKKCCGKNL